MIHRKLQNVVYMKKNRCSKKKKKEGGGQHLKKRKKRGQHRVLSTRTCDEYMTFLYVVHVYMFCNVVLYCIALPASVLFAIKIIIY